VLSYLVLTQAMEVPADRIEWVTAPWWLPITAVLTIVLATVAGLLASLRALAERPIAVLRGES
jgi:ABC-type antimicrobial peptide transport system permease subunit